MAHRQGLDDSSTNIHGGAVRVGRVLEGALARAAVRNGEVVDLHADAGAVLLAKRSVQIAPAKALADWRNPVGGGGAADENFPFKSFVSASRARKSSLHMQRLRN